MRVDSHDVILREVPTDDDRPVLNYAPPERPAWLVRLALAVAERVLIAAVLFVAALLVPHPEGIWYFGHRPQWMVAIDHAGLTIGPNSGPALLGWFPLLVAKLIVIAVPVWLVWTLRARLRRANQA